MKIMNFFSLFSPKILKIYKSKINKEIEIVKVKGNKIIYVRGAEQTGGTITGMWQKALSYLKARHLKMKNCLILGLGGGDALRIIRKIYPEIAITAVELDPVMISIASKYYGIKNTEDTKIIKNDALYYLMISKKKYDLIIVDLFIGFNNPLKFRNLKFLKLIEKNMANGGVAVYNSHFSLENQRDFEIFHNRCALIFPRCEIIVSYPFSRILQLSRH